MIVQAKRVWFACLAGTSRFEKRWLLQSLGAFESVTHGMTGMDGVSEFTHTFETFFCIMMIVVLLRRPMDYMHLYYTLRR